jgi:hypothetical protein
MSQCASSSWLMPCPLRVGHHSTRKPILLQGFIHSDVEAFWFGYNVWTARWWLACPNTWGTTKQNHAFEWERSQKATIKRFKWQFSKKEIYIGEHTGMSQISGTRVFTSTYPNRFWQILLWLFPSSTATKGDGIHPQPSSCRPPTSVPTWPFPCDPWLWVQGWPGRSMSMSWCHGKTEKKNHRGCHGRVPLFGQITRG